MKNRKDEVLARAWRMWEEGKIGTENCEGCPYQAECENHEWYWSCGVWEEYMGEDL